MLTALELSGFKSFADRTRLEFPAGVTAVVGPNGSGKSNVVDGIKWVLGSQSPKALRGSEMTDVIFNGSTTRRPVNTAEVTLEFDNTSGLFPAGGPIVEGEPRVRLTRRVYRSGEGEYLINGSTVRLRDLKNLLAGTGMGGQGSGSYGIIEQGRVDGVLQSSPGDRRALFEEAAGISRFRIKKQEASRRLARVEQNLLRLSDIVDEVEGRLRRVRAQAGKAKRYREQADRLKQLRTELGLADWRTLTASLNELEAAANAATERRDAAQRELDEQAAALEAKEAETDAGAEQHAADERQLVETREAIAGLQVRLATESQRVEQAEQNLTSARQKILQSSVRAEPEPEDESSHDKQAIEEQLATATERSTAADAAVAAAQAEHQAARDTRRELTDKRQSAHRVVIEAEARVVALEANEQEGAATLDDLRASGAEHLRLIEHETTERDTAAADVEQHTQRVQQAAEALAEARSAVASCRERLLSSQKELARVEAELVSVRHRHDTIEAFEGRLEKLAADIRGVLTAGANAPTVHGMVADLLHVDYDTAPMIEAALGAAAQHLVVDTADRLVNALAGGEAALRVRASFQRLDATHPLAAIDRVDLTGEPGVMGRADTFVDSDPLYQPLVRRLLGRTWFVDSLATAARLSTGAGRGLTFVTHSGDVLSADGGIFVGPKGDEAGLITGRQQATDLEDDLQRLENSVTAKMQEIAELEAATIEATDHEHACFEQHTQATGALAESKQTLATLDERVATLTRGSSDRAGGLAAAEKKLDEVREELRSVRWMAEQARGTEQELDEQTQAAAERVAAAESAAAAAATAATDARVELAKTEHALQSLRTGNQKRRQGNAEQDQLLAELTRQREQAASELQRGELAVLAIRAELAERYLVRDHLAAATAAVNAKRQQLQQARRRDAKRVQKLRDAVAQQASEAQRCELEATQLRHNRKTLTDRMQEDYGIDLAAVAAEQPEEPTTPTPDSAARGDLERELEQLRAQVQTIGPVNSEALEELDDLESRFEQLSGQYKDLSAAKTSLERLTGRINADSRELFLTTIDTVRGHFRELFRRLFGGGEADLVLMHDEGEDVLEAGVEIVAQPPGKELSSISLLSGGEKTMTCVALLLALFRTKPSPFCVLDEVDAALDEANIGRFTTVITEFLASTQFLVVTHSKKTMMGADTIYGVTMQESGVSTRVGVRFEDVGDDGQLRVPGTSNAVRKAA